MRTGTGTLNKPFLPTQVKGQSPSSITFKYSLNSQAELSLVFGSTLDNVYNFEPSASSFSYALLRSSLNMDPKRARERAKLHWKSRHISLFSRVKGSMFDEDRTT